MKMKKVLAFVLALAMVFCFVACKQKDPDPTPSSKLVEKKGVTVPAFTVTVNGVAVTNEMMADYPVYEASVGSTNSSGTTSTVVYIGFKVSDMVKAAALEGTAGKITATADDGYSTEWEDGASENNMIAISKDGTQFKKAPWFIPCDSETTGDQLKGCVDLKIEGLTAPGQDPAAQLADPVKEDKSDKIKFADFSFKINGNTITNKDLEGLKIYRITVEVQTKTGEVQEHKYSGYVLSEVLDKLKIDASSMTVVASDGYESEIGGGIVKNEYTLIAIECDKEVGENGTIWIAPCSSHETKAYCKLVVGLNSNK